MLARVIATKTKIKPAASMMPAYKYAVLITRLPPGSRLRLQEKRCVYPAQRQICCFDYSTGKKSEPDQPGRPPVMRTRAGTKGGAPAPTLYALVLCVVQGRGRCPTLVAAHLHVRQFRNRHAVGLGMEMNAGHACMTSLFGDGDNNHADVIFSTAIERGLDQILANLRWT